MTQDIKEIGERFKRERKRLNLSLKEVENATSIRSAYIEAIEEGRKERFLSPVYMLGFLKQYANFLGLDGEEMIRDHPKVFEIESNSHDFSYGIGTLEVRGSLKHGVKWLPSLAWAALLVVVLVASYYFAKYLGVL